MKDLKNVPDSIQKKMLSISVVNKYIGNNIYQNKAFLAARFGSVEGGLVAEVIIRNNYHINDRMKICARNNAGIANVSMKKFAIEYLNAASKADLLAIWKFTDQMKLAEFSENENYCRLPFLDPFISLWYDCEYIWTSALKGKKVLVIHPFANTIESQYNKRTKIQTISTILPEFNLLTLLPPTTTEEGNQYLWLDELQEMKRKISCIDFDVAIIGAGGYGLPLGAFIRDIGKTAIHLGGSTQLLFGIIGKRWEERYKMDGFIGNGWVRPSLSERPNNYSQIEQGCYW